MIDNTLQIRRQMVEYCERLYDRDLVGSTQGNISLRHDSSWILITPTGSNLGYLDASDIVVITKKGKKVSGKGEPSSEYDLHLKIYEARKDVKVICHAHPIGALSLSLTESKLNKLILPEIINVFGTIPIVEYGTPGNSEVFDKLDKYVQKHDAFILRSHGAVTLGKSLDEAYNKMEMLERYAWTIITVKQLGKIKELPVKQANKLPGYERVLDQLSND